MTLAETFYLFILPAMIAVGALGWIAYARHADKHDHLHPGE